MHERTYGLIGHPVRHSLSPAMQNAAFKEAGVDAEYLLYDIQPEKLDDFLGGLTAARIAGVNVTIPHKVKAKEYLERSGSLDDNARRLGAVNTIQATPDGLRGYNTDGPGFYRSLVEDLKFEPENKNIFVLGAGGAAMAVIMYLGNGPKTIFVSDIDSAKTAALGKQYARYFDPGRLVIVGEGDCKQALAASDLLVNATPLGMKEDDPSPVDKGLLHQRLFIYDLVYNRPQTVLVKEAARMKRHAVTGLGMLLRQGAIAFEIWTGKKAPVDVMKRALKEAMKGQQ